MATDYQLDLGRLDQILARLTVDERYQKVSCGERVLFLALTAAIYAVPLLTAAVFVSSTFYSVGYGPMVETLRLLLSYDLVAVGLLALSNLRLGQKTWEHRKLTRKSDVFRLADYLMIRRGRLEESPDAIRLLLRGGPWLFIGLLVASGVATLIGVLTETTSWEIGDLLQFSYAGVACLGFYHVQPAFREILEFPRQRIDYAREVQTLKRTLEQKRRKAQETNKPLTLDRPTALRLSDLDRMHVLRQSAAALVHAEHPLRGFAVVRDDDAQQTIGQFDGVELVVLESALTHLALEVARHVRRGALDEEALAKALRVRRLVLEPRDPWMLVVRAGPDRRLEVVFAVEVESRQIDIRHVRRLDESASSHGGAP